MFHTHYPVDEVRRTQFAGTWYESNPETLSKEIDGYLAKAKTEPDAESNARVEASSPPISGSVMAIISPHAGYMFSGQTAAFAYKSAQAASVKRIFLLGPSHYVGFTGAALPQAKQFATPLGNIDVDTTVIDELRAYPPFSTQVDVHKVEHSLELQLPYIKHCFPNTKIVPIVVGQLNGEPDARFIGSILKGFIGKGDLVVVSSDFTHYGPRYGYTPFMGLIDAAKRVEKMDGEAYTYLRNLDLKGFVEFLKRTGDTICGMFPCQVLLAMLPQTAHGTLLKYATSKESTAEDKNNSVSYLSIVFSGGEWPETPGAVPTAKEMINLNAEERKTLLTLARKSIETFLKEKRHPSPEQLGLTITPAMKECFGVFVTLNQLGLDPNDKEGKDLRGCIGSIYPVHPMHEAVQENAVAAATRDPRFIPVTLAELEKLVLDINVLTPPRRISSWNEIVIGRDGVILSKGNHQAVFLPQVAVEWGWNLEEMLTQLSLKAGLTRDAWREGAKFDVFQSEEIHEK